METMIINSEQVLNDGGQAYARINLSGSEKIIPASMVEIMGFVSGKERISARFEIEDYDIEQIEEVYAVRDITIYVLNKGILYAIPSVLEDVALDSTVRFTTVMPTKCRGAILRKTERFSVLGTYRLYRRGISDVGCKLFAVPMNISLGGFGMQMETPDIERGEEVHFEISLFTDSDDQDDQIAPSVDIHGIAKICNLLELSSENISYVGFGFTNVPSGITGALAFWLKSHQGLLSRA